MYGDTAPSDGPIRYVFMYSGSKRVERVWNKLSTMNSIQDMARCVKSRSIFRGKSDYKVI